MPPTANGAPAPHNPAGISASSAAAPVDAAAQAAPGRTAQAASAATARPSGEPVRRPLISGTTLSELLSAADPEEEPSDGETPDAAEPVETDPECAEKLECARAKILSLIQQKRPRFVAAFELMSFRGNTISVSVPTEELREEILRSKTGMLMRVAELAGIRGAIELEVIVNEQIRAVRPIKLEDRVRYLTEKNPRLADLRKVLDLEVE